jgi:branched-chain amino acid transport system permease protein
VDLFAQLLANGVIIGATYALVAIGLTLIFGMMRVVNFAHGEFYMLGAYAAVSVASAFPLLGYFGAVPVAIVAISIIGLLFERIFLRPLRNADILSTALVTIGLSIFFQNTALVIWGPKPGQVVDPFGGATLPIAGVGVAEIRLFTVVVAVAAMGGLGLLLKYTKFGRMMRATFQDRDAAALQGIEVDRVFSLSFVIGAALASLAGALLSAVFVVSPDMGNMANLKSFAVVILGGLGNIPGAVVGGFLLGLAESFGAGYISAGYKDGISFLLLIVILLIRPYGLFGREGSEA